MDQQQLEPLQEMRQWLDQHMNQTIHIEKIEDEDLDRVQIHLKRVNVGQQQIHDPDDYVPDQALILHGAGEVENELQNRQSHLPQQAYEIPITPNMLVEQQGHQLLISTERAVYRLETIQ